jgi:hypothetical protein
MAKSSGLALCILSSSQGFTSMTFRIVAAILLREKTRFTAANPHRIQGNTLHLFPFSKTKTILNFKLQILNKL